MENNMPLVSVIMPAYNCENFVLKSISSVVEQNYKNLELIIVDDCSKDNTNKVISDFIKDYKNIKLIKNNENSGVGQTRNNGIKIANGEYIAFIDSDDIWKNDKLEKQLKVLKENNGKFCYTSYSFIDENDSLVNKPYIVPEKTNYNNLLKENVIGNSTVLIEKNLLGDNSFTKDFFHEDFVLWLKILKKINFAYGITEPLVFYRTGGRSSNKLKAAKNRWLILRKSENLGIFKSIGYMLSYIVNGVKKHY